MVESRCYMQNLRCFNYWCHKVLPLVYDDSLSYYEQLCKIYEYLNNMIKDIGNLTQELNLLKQELEVVKNWIDNFDTSYAEEVLKNTIATMIFVEISKSGYIIYNIPENWSDITFNTTGLDIQLELQPNYGHLVLSY